MLEWRKRRSELLYEGKRVRLFRDDLLVGDREVIREVVRLRGAAAALPILDDGRIILIKQFRYPALQELLEVPAGVIEEGETPEECIRRELAEETGYSPAKISHLVSIHPSPGVLDEVIHIFLATGLTQSDTAGDEDEQITAKMEVGLEDALRMIRYGEITDAKTIIALLFFSMNYFFL